jgi:predicted transcriptional regulator
MKLRKARIIVESFDEVNQRWEKALGGKLKTKGGGEVISVGSWEILGKVLSPPRLQILAMIPQLKPKSIAHLARGLKKNFKNVYSDVKFLADLGLIELKEQGPRKTLVPVAKFNEIELPLAA